MSIVWMQARGLAQVRHCTRTAVLNLSDLKGERGPTPFVLDGTAHEIWQLLETPSSVSTIAQLMVERYGIGREEAGAAVDSFVGSLSALGLLQPEAER